MNLPPIYMLVAYKDDIIDHRHGDYEGSGFEICNGLTWEHLKETYARFALLNQQQHRNHWQLHVFHDGIRIIDNGQAHAEFWPDYDAENWEEQEAFEKELNAEAARFLREVVEPLERQRKAASEASAREEAARRQRVREAEETRERETYERLKSKFEPKDKS